MLGIRGLQAKCFYPISNVTCHRTFAVNSRFSARKRFDHDNPIECEGFTYYPRFPDHEDPPCEPSKLFRIQRIKPLKGAPFWEKTIMHQLKLDGKQSDVVIIKNIPENNARLWKVKHLVRITPITFPNGPPEESDIGATFLKENGELMVSKKLEVKLEQLEVDNEKEKLKMDPETIKKQCRLKWLNAWQT